MKKPRRRFNRVRFRRKTLITLCVSAFVFVCVRSCGEAKANDTEPEQIELTVSATVEPEDTYTFVPLARYPVPLDDDLQYFIIQSCEEHHISPSIVFAMIDRESDFIADKVGDDGDSYGLMQIQPRWHYERMDELGCHDLLDPYQNVTVGIDYLAELIDYGNGIEWAVMAYNTGPNDAYAKANLGAVTEYAKEVLENSEILTEGVQAVMYRTDDPLVDFDRWDAEQARREADLPRCDYCDDPIQDDYYRINDEVICRDCLDSHFLQRLEEWPE